MEIVGFECAHLPAILLLCAEERWEALANDAERTMRVLIAPGVTTVVALDEEGSVIGFAELFSDGEIQAYLSALVVATAHRRSGVGQQLVVEGLRRAGGQRLDLLSANDAVAFYGAFDHQTKPGFRVYPKQR